MEEIKKYLEKGKVIMGSKVVIKKLNNSLIKKIFIASNCKEEIKQDIEKLAKLSSVEIVNLEMKNNELGTFCRKPFHISVVGVLKE